MKEVGGVVFVLDDEVAAVLGELGRKGVGDLEEAGAEPGGLLGFCRGVEKG